MKRINALICLSLLVACGEKEPTEPQMSEAPVVVSSTPSSGATGIAEGKLEVEFVFDQNIRCGSDAAEKITVSPGASVTKAFAYNTSLKLSVEGLVCETTYTLGIPAGVVKGYKDNQRDFQGASLVFTTVDGPLSPPKPGKAPDGWENSSAAVLAMGTGWNLGNTMDSNGDWIATYGDGTPSSWETAWGQPVTQPSLLKMFESAGFGAIRVPVTWKEHFGSGDKIDEAWMARVEEIVNYVLDAGMYCIINAHHDTGTDGWLHASSANYSAQNAKFKNMWTQIATRFNKYGDKLLFESFNEILDDGNNWGSPGSDAVDAVNRYNADFVSTVRATGGNNAHRNLVINTYAAGTDKKALDGFVIPEDSTKEHLIAEFHSYAPYRFAFHQDDPAMQITVFGDACYKEVESQINNATAALHAKGVPCIIGEYGADSASANDTELGKQATCYVSTARKNDTACFYWMALSDGADRSVPKWTKPIIKDAILKAMK